MASTVDFDIAYSKPNWCPGCGDFGIWVSVKQALTELSLEPHQVVLVSGIGCSSKLPYWINTYGFQGLHGRPLPVATGIKLSNHNLNVFAVGGDGDGYGEGGNHFIHACRRNMDFVYLVHDNMVYGLTTGQTSPTSEHGFKTKATPDGSIEIAFNPLAIAIASGCTFVARGFAGDVKHLVKLIAEAHQHRGFALIDILQPCVTYNHVNTYQYYFQRVYKLEEAGYQPNDKIQAFTKALEWGDKIPVGVIYKEERPIYTDELPQIKDVPLVNQPIDNIDITPFLNEFT